MASPEKVQFILAKLDECYPQAHCSLDFTNPLELLVATVLSAQCTDTRVNQVTHNLFKTYRTASDYAGAPPEEVEQAIYTTGFFRQKAKSIRAICQVLVEKFNGEVPPRMENLVQLPGIGRKTANVILGNAFGIPGIVVDTHVIRVSGRLGLTQQKNPEKIEQDLMPLIPPDRWTKFSHQVISHGREVCVARKPRCPVCALLPQCDFGQGQ